jgi:hypothetical protein
MAEHERVSDQIIRHSEVADVLKELGSGFADDVADIIQGAGKKTVYHAVVSSQFDVYAAGSPDDRYAACRD